MLKTRRRGTIDPLAAGLLALCLCGLPLPAAGDDPAAGPEPWLTPFNDDVQGILAAAAAVEDEDDEGVVVLLRDIEASFDEAGRRTYRRRLVYRLTSARRLSSWDRVSILWKPWHQDRPTIEARVITAAGEVHPLDQATLDELPRYEDHPDILSDWRQLQAPLPAIGVGAVVEEVIEVRDREVLFEGGAAYRFGAEYGLTVEHVRVAVEAPASLPLVFKTELLDDAQPERQELGDRVRLVWDLGRVETVDVEPSLPGDVPRRPLVGFAVGEGTWAEVARSYSEVVEAQLDGDELETVVADLVRGKEGRREKIGALVRWLQSEVRYTGLEFGEAAIVPRSPAETLKRRYGDCKDKSLLTVALLRRAGIPAHLALLNAGSGRDTDPDLPGLGNFDHAIVYVPAGEGSDEPELWYDATAEYSRVGQLPSADQDRWALIAAPGTTGLVRTPPPRSRESGETAVREVFLAEVGRGRVVESTTMKGGNELLFRRIFSELDADKVHELIEDAVLSVFQDGELATFEHSDPRDPLAPLTYRTVVEDVAAVETDLAAAEISYDLSELVAGVVAALPEGDEDEDVEDGEEGGEDGGDGGGDEEVGRRGDFAFAEPYFADFTLRIVIPPGFEGVDLPEDETRELGPATLKVEVTEGEGEVTARMTFDAGPGRIGPRELEALKAGIDEVLEAEPLEFRFEQVGEAHLAAGRIREALEEFRRLAALEPESALVHTRIARALLTAGLGEAARREARRAVELDPDFHLVYQTLGYTLIHDLLGRPFVPGIDYEVAEEAFRKARELGPDIPVNRQNLAVLLEHDADGERYGPRSKLDEAIAEYRALRDDLEVTALDDSLLVALFRAGRVDESLSFARELEPTVLRLSFLVASLAVSEGFDAAFKEALRADEGDPRRQVLANAADLLMVTRRYALAADFVTAAAKGSPKATELLGRAGQLRRTVPFEELIKTFDGPKAYWLRVLRASLWDDEEALAPVFEMLTANGVPEDDVREAMASERSVLRSLWQGVTVEAGFDQLLTIAEMVVDGDAELGYRLRLRLGGEDAEEVYLLASEGGGFELVAVRSMGGLAPIGRHVLELLDAGEPEAARRWLDWAHEGAVTASGGDPLSGASLVHFWSRGREASAEEMRLAAAALLVEGVKADLALPILEERLAAEPPEDERLHLEVARAKAFLALERFAEVAEVGGALLAAEPISDTAFQLAAFGLTKTDDLDGCERVAHERLERLPGDRLATAVLAEVAERREDFAKAVELLRGVVKAGRSEAGDYNQLAWLSLVRGDTDNAALDDAQQAVRLAPQDPSILHTLAAVFAELGWVAEAREVILQAMVVAGREEPAPHDWYVLGRIAEHYGEIDAAAEAYQRVEPDEDSNLPPSVSSHALAQRRLKALSD